MIIFLYGPDTFRSLQKLKELKNRFLREVEGGSLNLADIDGEKLTYGEFKKQISTVSFMSRKRMIILRNIISKGKDKNLQKEIIDFLKKDAGGNENVLIFWEEEKKEKDVLFKFLTGLNAGSVFKQEFELLKGVALKKWIIKEVSDKGGEIKAEAVNMLIERIGSDLWSMNNEIEKIISYDKNVTCENIKKFVKTKDDDNIFNLVDAIGAKNKKLALRLLTEQIRLGVNINYILAMLARQYRLLLEAKDYLARDNRANSRSLALGLKIHPFVAQKLYSQVSFYNTEALKKIYRCIMNIDLKSKSSSVNIELLLDMLIVA
ncbi:MAG: DNA polymerase III subunit delta [bacterium]